jgi:acid stress-induced BolA-like protein IbaG/YrbA
MRIYARPRAPADTFPIIDADFIQAGFSMTPSEIEQLIQTGLPGASVTVNSDDNTHFEAIIVSTEFAGKRALQRHQMIYRTLGDAMGGAIHALSIEALTPEEHAGD